MLWLPLKSLGETLDENLLWFEDISYPNKYKLEKLLTNVLDKSSQQADLCLNLGIENILRTLMLQCTVHYKINCA